jgi:hypothetical protein
MASDAFHLKLQAFDFSINDRFKNCLSNEDILETSNIEEDQLNNVYLSFEEEAVVPEEDEIPDTESYGQYITARVLLPRNDTYEKATVTCRKRDNNGNLMGHAHTNPLLDTRIYEVQFPDGASSEYSANVIAENIFATVDDNGFQTVLLDEIVDHQCDCALAVNPEDAWIVSCNGNKTPWRTTKGWELCVRWKDQSTNWLPLKDSKASNPVQVAEYAIARNLQYEPAFSWWVQDTL